MIRSGDSSSGPRDTGVGGNWTTGSLKDEEDRDEDFSMVMHKISP